MLLYIPEALSVDEAKAIDTQLFAIAYDQEEAKLKANYKNPLTKTNGIQAPPFRAAFSE